MLAGESEKRSGVSGITINKRDVPQPLGWGFRAQPAKPASLGLAANLMPAYPTPRAGGENQASGCSLTSLVWRLRRLARLVKTEATQVRSVGLCPALQQRHASTHTGQGIGRRACQANPQDGSATGSPEVLCVFLTRDGRGLCPEGRKSQRGRQGAEAPAFKRGSISRSRRS